MALNALVLIFAKIRKSVELKGLIMLSVLQLPHTYSVHTFDISCPRCLSDVYNDVNNAVSSKAKSRYCKAKAMHGNAFICILQL